MKGAANRLLLVAVIIALQHMHLPRNDASVGLTALYFLSCQLADLAICWVCSKLAPPGLALDLQAINLAAVVAHFLGFVLYVTYSPPLMYNVLIYSLLCAELARFFWPHHDDIGLLEDCWCRAVDRDNMPDNRSDYMEAAP